MRIMYFQQNILIWLYNAYPTLLSRKGKMFPYEPGERQILVCISFKKKTIAFYFYE